MNLYRHIQLIASEHPQTCAMALDWLAECGDWSLF